MSYVKIAMNDNVEVKINFDKTNYKEVCRDLSQLFLKLSYDEAPITSSTINLSALFTPNYEDDTDDSINTWDSYPEEYRVDSSDEVTSDVVIPEIEEEEESAPTNVRKLVRPCKSDSKLLIVKCTSCHHQSAIVSTEERFLHDTFTCKKCSNTLDTTEYYPASYTCTCGNRSTLNISKYCKYITCKKCRSKISMSYDYRTNSYIGVKSNT